jgi:hypothetical protein
LFFFFSYLMLYATMGPDAVTLGYKVICRCRDAEGGVAVWLVTTRDCRRG